MGNPLNHKQRAFARAYTTPGETYGNGTRSAIAAGCSARAADSQAVRLLADARVRELITANTDALEVKTSRTADKVLEELARLGFSDVTAIFNDDGTLKHPKDMPVEVRRAIKSIEFEELFEGNRSNTKDGEDGGRFVIGRIVKVVLHSKEKGLELLGKNLKLFTDKVEHSVDDDLADLLAKARSDE